MSLCKITVASRDPHFPVRVLASRLSNSPHALARVCLCTATTIPFFPDRNASHSPPLSTCREGETSLSSWEMDVTPKYLNPPFLLDPSFAGPGQGRARAHEGNVRDCRLLAWFFDFFGFLSCTHLIVISSYHLSLYTLFFSQWLSLLLEIIYT